MNHPSIYSKGLVLVIIPFLSQAVFLATLVKIRIDQADTQRWVLHATRVLAEADDLSALFAETHSALRGFLITEDPSLSRQYQAYKQRSTAKIVALGALVGDNESQRERVRVIEARALTLAAWFDRLHDLIAARQRDEALKEARTSHGEELTGQVRDAIHDFLRTEETLTREREARLQRQAMLQDAVLFGGGALAVLSTALLAYVFARGIAIRVKALAENARRLG